MLSCFHTKVLLVLHLSMLAWHRFHVNVFYVQKMSRGLKLHLNAFCHFYQVSTAKITTRIICMREDFAGWHTKAKSRFSTFHLKFHTHVDLLKLKQGNLWRPVLFLAWSNWNTVYVSKDNESTNARLQMT